MKNDDEFQFPEENEESPSCEHCELKFNRVHQLIHDFIDINNDKNSTLDDLADLFAEFYDLSYEDGEKEAYHTMGNFALEMANENNED